jgi:hypothetical protein
VGEKIARATLAEPDLQQLPLDMRILHLRRRRKLRTTQRHVLLKYIQ